jgi:hypothetical protein
VCFVIHPVTAGMNPAGDLEGTNNGDWTCVKCLECGAALALQTRGSGCRRLAEIDADLLTVVFAWEEISGPIRKAILSLVESSR